MNVKDFHPTPEQWVALLTSYGVPATSLDGKGRPCPMCNGTDRFTYDNKRGRGDWVCRGCGTNGKAAAGDGLQLICRVTGMTFRELMEELDPGTVNALPVLARSAAIAAPAPRKEVDREWIEQRLTTMWRRIKPLVVGDLGMRYLRARVPGLNVEPSAALRLGMLDYFHDRNLLGKWPAIVQRFILPDGRLGTLHRTYLDHDQPKKATVVSPDGEILDAKKNDLTLNKLNGGAVRLMEPVNAEIGVAEGLETAYAALMLFGVPVWNCLNRVLLADFVVPDGLGIRVVHIFADFDAIDPKTRKSPGMDAALALAKRLRADGFTAIVHRPRKRGTDFADEWLARASVPTPVIAPAGKSSGQDVASLPAA
jgi:putative DNA primase/helicase